MSGIVLAATLLVQSFTGLSLAQAQTGALAHSPDVAIARSKVQEAQALFDAARANYGPALFGNYALSPQAGNGPYTVSQRLTTVGAQVTLGDLIAYSPLVAQANASLLAARFDLAGAERAERINVIALYYAALTAEATLNARRTALTGATSDLRAAKLRFGNGDVPRLDVVRADVAVAQAQADLARAQAEAENAEAALATETQAGSAALALAQTPAPAAVPVTIAPEAAVSLALAHRPEIASAQEAVRAEERAVEIARAGGLPVVTVSGGYSKGVDTEIPVQGPSLTVNATLPVGGAQHDRVVAEQARLSQARSELERAQRQVTTEVGAAVRTYQAQTQALSAAQRALAEASAAFRATQIGYRNGASSSLDVETARATYVQALVAQITSLYAQLQAQATLQLLIGSTHA
ncbi:MAG TPA: TolC family protein [Candidatus Aquilonibacter sp.]|nr:TolC family protein [Candidatus Aquilonibacter sp.]